LGIADLGDCSTFDSDGDGSVGIAELIAAIHDALLGCV
jgi:hypothetical protein